MPAHIHTFASCFENGDLYWLQFIPKLSHEADGLIFQPWESHYVIGTAEDLLKWKFAHLNSVDFKFMSNQGRATRPAQWCSIL